MIEIIIVVSVLYNIFFLSDYCVYRSTSKAVFSFKSFSFINRFKFSWLRFYWTVLAFIKYSSFMSSWRFIEKMCLNICIGFWVVRIFIENIDLIVRRVYLFIVWQIIWCLYGESFWIMKLLINLPEDSNRDSKEFIDSMGARYYFHLFFGCCCFLCCCWLII